VAVSGAYALLGAQKDDDDGDRSGSAYIFDLQPASAETPTATPTDPAPTDGSQLAKLVADDAAAGDEFGSAVAIDGDVAVVGSPLDDCALGTNCGAAYIFGRDSGGLWSQLAKLTSFDSAAGEYFGIAVALAGDYAVVGATGATTSNDAGSAYIFGRAGQTLCGAWHQVATLVADDAAAADNFGISVAISGDYAVVGAWGDLFLDSGSAYVFGRDADGTWTQHAKLVAADAAVGDSFGYAVAISGGYAVVGAYKDGCALGSDCGSAYVFGHDSDSSWTQIAKLVADDAGAGDRFGLDVAIDGPLAVVGAYRDDDCGGAVVVWGECGSAYVFGHDSDGSWTQHAKLVADDAAAADYFGYAVAIDDTFAVVGSYGDDDDGFQSGSATVFGRNTNGTWSQVAKLVASDAAASDHFGRAVGISGKRIVVGAPYDDDGGDGAGSASVFDLGGNGWTQVAKLVAADASQSDNFGYAVATSGNVVAVGAYWDDDDGTGSGSAYMFGAASTALPTALGTTIAPTALATTVAPTVAATGSLLTQLDKLTANDAAAGDNFGMSVAMFGDYAVVGAFQDDDGGASSGSAFVFETNNNGTTWTQVAKLVADDAAVDDYFSFAVAISGFYVIVGAPGDDDDGDGYDDDGAGSGAAYIFIRDSGVWTQCTKLVAADAAAGDQFGRAVGIDSGGYAVVGAWYDDDGGTDSGSAYVFGLGVGGNWTQVAKLVAADADAYDYFGFTVAISGSYAAVGAFGDNCVAGGDCGSAYVFGLGGGGSWTRKP